MGIVSYYRVSTVRQGQSGLGLEAQRADVEAYSKSSGLPIVREFTEIETGKRGRKLIDLHQPIWTLIDNRPSLQQAIRFAKAGGHKLVIAKFDRLARDATFTLALHGSGADFVACDNPHANEMTVGIMAVVAQQEAKMISDRTKAALAAYVARGGKMGWARDERKSGDQSGRIRGLEKCRQVNVESARKAHAEIIPIARSLRAAGSTLPQIAEKLNADGHTTRRGKRWSPTQVFRVLKMAV